MQKNAYYFFVLPSVRGPQFALSEAASGFETQKNRNLLTPVFWCVREDSNLQPTDS